jgi:Uma2 family endonuclease
MVAAARNASDVARGPMTIAGWWIYLPMRVRLAEPLDDDALLKFCAANSDLRIERTSDGELIIMPPTGGETGNRNHELNGQFFVWGRQDGTGKGFDSSSGFTLPNGAMRSPDYAWVLKSRWDVLTKEQQRKFAPLCPDFVMELRSESDLLHDQQAKLDEYIVCGARLGWLIDPIGGRAYIYRPGRAVEMLERPIELRGDPELPGLVIDLREIW